MIESITSKLEKVRPNGSGKFMACCPAHDDRNPSLSIMEMSDGRILIHCFAGCTPLDVLSAIGLEMGDLFPDGGLGEFKGWQQIITQGEQAKAKKLHDSLEHERNVLAVADFQRKSGEPLNQVDLKREREAFLRIKEAG